MIDIIKKENFFKKGTKTAYIIQVISMYNTQRLFGGCAAMARERGNRRSVMDKLRRAASTDAKYSHCSSSILKHLLTNNPRLEDHHIVAK
jgi:hypothetical protein